MRRRDFVLAMSGVTASWPFAALAQPAAMPVIGMLASASPESWSARLDAFHQGLGETGYAEGRNVALTYRWAAGRNDLLPGLAADLVRLQVSVIVVLGNTTSALAAKAATRTIPIVFRTAVNPVEVGLVASLNRPGGNITGVTTLGVELGPKQLDLIHELVPAATVVALLINPTNPISDFQARNLTAAARTRRLQPHILKASSDREIVAALESMANLRAGMLIISADTFFNIRNEMLASLAIRHGVPAISPYRDFAEAGGLLSYGGSIPEAARLAGTYTGRILKGEKPGDLPVPMAVKVELIVNMKTAKALRISVPDAFVIRANEMIE